MKWKVQIKNGNYSFNLFKALLPVHCSALRTAQPCLCGVTPHAVQRTWQHCCVEWYRVKNMVKMSYLFIKILYKKKEKKMSYWCQSLERAYPVVRVLIRLVIREVVEVYLILLWVLRVGLHFVMLPLLLSIVLGLVGATITTCLQYNQRVTFTFFLASPMNWLLPDSVGPVTFFVFSTVFAIILNYF